MSMCGELENLEFEIATKKLELESLEKRKAELIRILDAGRQPFLKDMDLDPARRNWEYDGYGQRRQRIARSGE